MRYSEFSKLYDELSATTKKLEKADILAKFLPRIKEHEEWIYLLRGRVLPDYDEREFGMSSQLMIKAISKATGVTEEKVKERMNKVGDLGDLAAELLEKKKQSNLFSSSLTVSKVFENLTKIFSIDGKGSVEKKLALVVELLVSASAEEARYIIRTVLNDLRVGVADAILRDAIVKSFFNEEDVKEVNELVEEAYDKVNDFALVLNTASKGKAALRKIEVVPGRPMKVMLPVKVTEIEEGFRICASEAYEGKIAVEHKYDGFRVVINKDGDDVSLFTRKLDNVTNQFPDVVETVRKHVSGKSFVLDSEVVGYNPTTKKYKPFEAISQRIRRKYDIDKLEKDLPVEINVFDIIYHNGESKLNLPFIERRKLLEKVVKPLAWKIRLSTQLITNDRKEVEKFYNDALKIGEEGIMMKRLDAPYRTGRKVGYIVKMKPEANDLDLVITGAEYGTGKRAGGLTSFYVACKESRGKTDKFFEVGKVSSGLKEKASEGTSYKEINDLLEPLVISEEGNYVKVKPKIVVSVTYQNIQKSPRYSSGFALRFPRITHYRPERGVYDVASLDDFEKEAKKTHGRMDHLG